MDLIDFLNRSVKQLGLENRVVASLSISARRIKHLTSRFIDFTFLCSKRFIYKEKPAVLKHKRSTEPEKRPNLKSTKV